MPEEMLVGAFYTLLGTGINIPLSMEILLLLFPKDVANYTQQVRPCTHFNLFVQQGI